MQRRSFLKAIGLAPLTPPVEKCKGCGEYGHQWEIGTIRPKNRGYGDFAYGGHESIAWWCKNAKVDWTFYEKC